MVNNKKDFFCPHTATRALHHVCHWLLWTVPLFINLNIQSFSLHIYFSFTACACVQEQPAHPVLYCVWSMFRCFLGDRTASYSVCREQTVDMSLLLWKCSRFIHLFKLCRKHINNINDGWAPFSCSSFRILGLQHQHHFFFFFNCC